MEARVPSEALTAHLNQHKIWSSLWIMNQICEAVLYDPFSGHAIHLNIQFV